METICKGCSEAVTLSRMMEGVGEHHFVRAYMECPGCSKRYYAPSVIPSDDPDIGHRLEVSYEEIFQKVNL